MIKGLLKKIPVVGPLAVRVKRKVCKPAPFEGSTQYWENRYQAGGNSGAGSYDKLALFKAEVINAFVKERQVETVVEFGCGDGNQTSLGCYPSYVGFDISEKAIAACRQRFQSDPSKQFRDMSECQSEKAQLALSLDVIYHLVEDEVFRTYIERLFEAATRFVIIYASNYDLFSPQTPHVRHRHFTSYVEANFPCWKMTQHVPNRYPISRFKWGSFADFYIYELQA